MLRIRSILAALAVTLAACGGDGGSIDGTTGPSGPVPATPTGTYALETVDGKPLPAPMGKPFVGPGFTITAYALRGEFTFNADSTYTFTATAEIVGTGKVFKKTTFIEREGTYAFDASTITLTSKDGVITTMTRAGTTLTSNVTVPAVDGGTEAVTMVFSR